VSPFCSTTATFFVDQVTEKSIRRSDVLQTTKKIEVLEIPSFDALGDEGRHGVELEVQLSNGKKLQ